MTEVALRHDLDRSLIYRWRRAFGVRRARAAGAFLPVEVVDGTAAAKESSPARMINAPAPGAGRIEIEFSDGYLVRVDNQVDDDVLARVLRVLARQDDSGPDWRSGVAGHWSHRHEAGLSVAGSSAIP